ncbi:amidophosphoribosyltransferase [bacterium]|nr:amidophosphoribosyltransferase [bacterium]
MCGIAGVFNVANAQNLVANILFSIQHRGQESCGISVRTESGNVLTYKGMGLVKHVLLPQILEKYSGKIAIGHVRYPTAGKSNVVNSQPHSIELAEGAHMSVCSNGDIINYSELRNELETEHGFTFKSDNDGELIGRLIAFHHVVHKKPIAEAIFETQQQLKGAFSTVLIYRDTMYGFRDPHAFRPFSIGHISWDGEGEMPSEGTVFASESCAFGIVGARHVRDLEPGEIVKLEKSKPMSVVKISPKKRQHCVFELIYFSRPDSELFDEYVYDVRNKIGATLARMDNDIPAGDDLVVISVPDSSNFVALGYAEEKKVRFDMGLLRNHYVGRTFTRPDQAQRDEGVRQKFNPLPGFFKGKRVILVDDSIVRGTTLKKIVSMVRGAGAKEIHVRIGSPRVIGSCYYGIDTPTSNELIAAQKSLEEITAYLKADSLKYTPVDAFQSILKHFNRYCFACFNLDYIYQPADFSIPTKRVN